MIVVEMILCMRVYGIYGKKKVLYGLSALLAVCLVACIVIIATVGVGHNAINSSGYFSFRIQTSPACSCPLRSCLDTDR